MIITPYKIIIAGSRIYICDVKEHQRYPEPICHTCMQLYYIVDTTIKKSGFKPIEVVSGRARGIDTMGEFWASLNRIQVKPFPAAWTVYGKAAGHIRNGQMAEYADAAICIWDGESRGTQDMINKMIQRGKPVHIHKQKWPC